MRKQYITIMLVCTSIVLSACGNSQETDSHISETDTEIEITTDEQSTVDTTEIESEPEVYEEKTQNAIMKIERTIEAYHSLLEAENDFADMCQYDMENLSYSADGLGMTQDGKGITDSLTEYAVLMQYYDSYVNDSKGYYDLEEWISEQESSTAIKEMVYKESDIEQYNTNDYTMMEAIGLSPYLSQAKSIELGEMKETSEYVISKVPSAYVYPLICDGKDFELSAVFDENDRLLNIVSTDRIYDEGGFVYTWDSVYDFWGTDACRAVIDEVYDLPLACYDNTHTTMAKVYFSNYQVFSSDDTHPAKEGFVWKTVDCHVYAGDANCREYGISIYKTYGDCNNYEVSVSKESDDLSIVYNGVAPLSA